ncbi:multiple organellar RNA editing factor 2, chloroplastic-like, partial [Thalictrum thalictroides]
MEEALGESVQSLAPFTLMNYNHRLDNLFSYHHLSEKNSKWNSDHWLIVIKQRESELKTEAQTLDFFIKILAEAIGSEQEAKERIYIIWSNFPFGFGAEIDEETSNKLKGCPNVLKVLPDYSFDVKDKVSG